MNEKYAPREIEPKWQKIWADSGAFHTEVDRTKPEYYVLEMFSPILREPYTWGMFAIIRSAML